MPYIRVNGTQVFYTQSGTQTNRPSLVLIHGAGGSHADWPEALRQLPETSVYALDLPAHGRSEPPGYDTIADYANFVQDWLQTMGLTRVVLAGHSMGGAIVQEMALRRQTAVAAIILVGTSTRLRVTPDILDTLPHDPDPAIAFIQKYAWSRTAPAAVKAASAARLAQVDPAVLLDDYRACNQFDRVGQLGTVNVPALVISGEKDMMTPAKYGRFLAAELPNADYVEIAAAGHYLMLEQPTAVAAAMRHFLRTIN